MNKRIARIANKFAFGMGIWLIVFSAVTLNYLVGLTGFLLLTSTFDPDHTTP